MSNKQEKSLVYFYPSKIQKLLDRKNWSIRNAAKEIDIYMSTLQAHLNGSQGCRKPNFLQYVKTFSWEDMIRTVSKGMHLVEIWYKEETGNKLDLTLFDIQEKIPQSPELTVKKTIQKEAPSKIDKKQFLKPLVEWIEKHRKGKYFVKRKLKEIKTEIYDWFTQFEIDNNKIKSATSDEWTVEKIIDSKENFVILGESGSGKTTLLHNIILDLNIRKKNNTIPLYVSLAGYEPKNKKTLKDKIKTEIKITYNKYISNEDLSGNDFIFLFDHLDMVKTSDLIKVINDIKYLFSDNIYGKNRFIIACRINQYPGSLNHFKNLEIPDFNKDDIEIILKKYKIPELWHKIYENPEWLSFSQKPLLLNMLIKIYREHLNTGLELNLNKKTELYRLFIKDYNTEESIRLENAGKIQYFDDWKLEIITQLAFEMHNSGHWSILCIDARKIMKKVILEESRKDNLILKASEVRRIIQQTEEEGLIVSYDRHIFQFMHPTFQEFFCARYLFKSKNSGFTIIVHNIGNPDWMDVIPFYAGMLGDATKLVKTIFDPQKAWYLYIAGKCIVESKSVDVTLKKKIVSEIVSASTRDHDLWNIKGLSILSTVELIRIAYQIDKNWVIKLALGLIKNGKIFPFIIMYYHFPKPLLEIAKGLPPIIIREPSPIKRRYLVKFISLVLNSEPKELRDLYDYINRKYINNDTNDFCEPTTLNPPEREEIRLIKKLKNFLKNIKSLKCQGLLYSPVWGHLPKADQPIAD